MTRAGWLAAEFATPRRRRPTEAVRVGPARMLRGVASSAAGHPAACRVAKVGRIFRARHSGRVADLVARFLVQPLPKRSHFGAAEGTTEGVTPEPSPGLGLVDRPHGTNPRHRDGREAEPGDRPPLTKRTRAGLVVAGYELLEPAQTDLRLVGV